MKGCILILFLILSCGLAGQQAEPKYTITLDTFMLSDVTVTSTVPLNNSQIEKFYRTNYFSTIDNLAEHLDGVSLIKRGAYAMEPQMNGFSGGQLNITIDGMKMFGACTDKMDPITSYLEPANLKTITLEHGSGGNIHGTNIGGSIDLSLKDPGSAGTHPFSLSASSGFETVSASRNFLLSAGLNRKRWAWGINAVYRKSGLYRDGHGNRIAHSQFEKYNIHSAIRYTVDPRSALRADVLWDVASHVGYPALPMDVSLARAGLASIEYQRITPSYNLKAKAYYNSVYHVMDDSGRDSLYFVENTSRTGRDSVYMRMDMPGWSSTSGAYAQAVVNLDSRNTLTIKADTYMNALLAEMTMHMHFAGRPPEPPMYLQTWPDILRSVSGIYISNVTTFGRKFSVTVNGRIDYNFDKFRSQIAADQFSVLNYRLRDNYSRITKGLNISLRYAPVKSLLFSLEGGLSERMPTVSERFGYYLYNAYDGYDYIGNPFLRTEKSASGRFTVTYYNNGLKINLCQSVNFLSDYIMGITDTLIPSMNFYTNGLRVYRNLPHAMLYSTDLQALYKTSFGLSLFNLTKFTYGQVSPGVPLPLIPPLKNLVSVSYDYRGLSFQVDNETTLRQQRVNYAYGETTSPSYVLFNFKTGYHLMLKSSMFDFSAGVTNIFNVYYHEHLDWGHIPRPGRSFNFMVKYSF